MLNIYIYIYIWIFYSNVFSKQIKSDMIHHSFSWCFLHESVVPLGHTFDNRILIYNEDSKKNESTSDSYLCAWGSSGGYKHASVRNIYVQKKNLPNMK